MAVTVAKKATPGFVWEWEGKDRAGKAIRGELRAESEAVAKTQLRRQGINVVKIKRRRAGFGKRITEKDITLFTRQLATMMRAGVPPLQAFDIAAKGHSNPAVTKMLLEVRADVETGLSLAEAFRKRPLYFDKLFCNIIAAGETGGVLDSLLEKLATYKEKVMAIKGKIKSALIYPSAIVGTALIITAVIMIYVIPAFKDLFSSFGANLPAPTLFVIWLSDGFVHYWWLIFGVIFGGLFGFLYAFKRTPKLQGKAGSRAIAAAGDRRHYPQGHHRALGAHPVHLVRRRRAQWRRWILWAALPAIRFTLTPPSAFKAMSAPAPA